MAEILKKNTMPLILDEFHKYRFGRHNSPRLFPPTHPSILKMTSRKCMTAILILKPLAFCSVHKQKHHFSKPPDIKYAIFFPNTLSKGEATLGIYCNHCTFSLLLLPCTQMCFNESYCEALYFSLLNLLTYTYGRTVIPVFFSPVVFVLGLIFANFLCFPKGYFCLLQPQKLSLMSFYQGRM